MDVDTFTEDGYTITISADPDTENPRTSAAHRCELAMSHRKYDWPNDAEIDFGSFGGWDEIAEELRNNHGAVAVTTVCAYDHGEISFTTGERTGCFADPWDSGVAGLAYVTRENWKETQGTGWTGSDEQIARAREMIASDVAVYGQWANGECFSYTVTDAAGEELAYLGGIIGLDNATEEAREAADSLRRDES